MALFRNTLFFPLVGILLFPTQAFSASDIDQYLEELQRAEEQYGAYDQSLADAYLGLGAAYEANRELNEAVDAYLRGMHVQRVNNGLFDPGQIVYLEELAELEVGRSNWLEGSDHLTTAHAITVKNHLPGSMPVLKSASELIDLHLRAYSLAVEDSDKHLTRAEYLNENQLKGAGWVNEDINFTQERLQRTAYINYEMFRQGQQQGVYEQRRPNGSFGKTGNAPGLSPHFSKGKFALQQSVYVLRDANAEPELIAQGLAQIGDWYALFGKSNSARIYYQQAFDLYAASKGDEAATELFSEPLRIPTFRFGDAQSIATKKFRFSLDVTTAGKTSKIKLLTDKEGHTVRDLRRARSTVRAVRFRPVLTKDGPVAKPDSTLSVLLE